MRERTKTHRTLHWLSRDVECVAALLVSRRAPIPDKERVNYHNLWRNCIFVRDLITVGQRDTISKTSPRLSVPTFPETRCTDIYHRNIHSYWAQRHDSES